MLYQVTKEMVQLQNQLSQAIKNQIAMLNTSQGGGSGMRDRPMDRDAYSGIGSGNSHRSSLLGQAPRHFGTGSGLVGDMPRNLTQV